MPGKKSRAAYQAKRRALHLVESRQALKESRDGIAALQTLWPAAFPKERHLVRPLASGTSARIAERTGWNNVYARVVLSVWKARDGYCQAVLRYEHRYDLNGEVTEEIVDDRARDQAQQKLAARAARLLAQTGHGEKASQRMPTHSEV